MKCFYLVVLFVILTKTIAHKEPSSNVHSYTSDTLVFAQVIYRHGSRNIDRIYPNDPFKDEINWPGGIGQLTKEGKQQQYKLGKYFRRRYGKILGENYSAKKVYVQSTDSDRTLMSAQTNLAGLFYPSEEEKWDDNILWQPIPVHSTPKKYDNVLYAYAECPKYKAAYDDYMKRSAEVQRIYTEHADIFPYLSKKSGSNITTITDVYWLYDTLNIEKRYNKPLEEWAKKAIERNGAMEYIATFDFKTYADTPQLARLKSGFLLKEILEHFYQKVNSTLQPDRALWMYSAHDITIVNMLNALGLYELHIPPYASSLHFELFKTDESEHYVQIFYRKSEEEEALTPMFIPQCGEKCSLEKLTTIYSEIIPGDFHLECQL